MMTSNFRQSLSGHETVNKVTTLMKLDPFSKTNESQNNKLIEKNNFLLKMENRALKLKEVCSRFHKTFNGR